MSLRKTDILKFPEGMILNVHPFLHVMGNFITHVPVEGKWKAEKEIAERAGFILGEMLKGRKDWGESCPPGTRPEFKIYVERRIDSVFKKAGRKAK